MFSKKKMNTSRQIELDIARGLAVLFMIFIHTQLLFASYDVKESFLGGIIDFVGTVPSAPMFMFLLGVSLNYSRKNEPKTFYKRGAILISLGYLLNFLKGFLPSLINSTEYSSIYSLYYGITELINVDILHFSGLFMIVFGVFKRFELKTVTVGLIGIYLSLANIILLNFQVDSILPSAVTGLLWGSNHTSYFPFLTWAFYPIFGYIFGTYLIRCIDKKNFYILSLFMSIVVFILGTMLFNVLLNIPNGLISDNNYYHHILTDNITFTALVILEISLLGLISKYLPKFAEKIASRWSKNVTSIFFIHWIILSWSTIFMENNNLEMIEFIGFVIAVILLSDFLAYIYSKRKKRRYAL